MKLFCFVLELFVACDGSDDPGWLITLVTEVTCMVNAYFPVFGSCFRQLLSGDSC